MVDQSGMWICKVRFDRPKLEIEPTPRCLMTKMDCYRERSKVYNAGMETANPASPESTVIHRRLPRPLWIFVATVVILFTFIGLRIGLPLYRQAVVVQVIERLDGRISTKSIGPDWLRRIVGESRMNMFDPPVEVDLTGSEVTDAELECLVRLNNLESLALDGTRLTDAGLTVVGGLTRLKNLSLANTPVTDAGLIKLKGLKDLERLNLERTQVTDEGLVHLKGLTNLRRLSLEGPQFTDAGLEHLKSLSNLSFLTLFNSQVTPHGARSLRRSLPYLATGGPELSPD